MMVFGEKKTLAETIEGEKVFVTYRVFDRAGTVFLGVAAWGLFVFGMWLG